jgi:nucleoid-associated protein YgaU
VVLLIVVAAVVGSAIGVSLGLRQGGPLANPSAANGRPTIVLVTAVPSPSVAASPVPSVVSPTAVVATQPQGSTEYVVQPGDTLRTIAQQEYGDATLWPRIYDANRDVIGPDPDELQPGTRLHIPSAG